ncbi:Ldh family oxidoreductase [Falsirhodobacter xinxiangensis]|uniref:Ldh family oxidoreductase n=1 Tax=Falsirhodobacter xinxiangensis TaxID=2530049 RepID=UPI0010A9BC63|nr:Ldh family oxidoreductase [Rhodobacter xinxiangensis]
MPLIDRIELTEFARAMLAAAGLEDDKARATAEILVEGDMIGHETHGTSLVSWYLDELDGGLMAKSGSYDVVSDHGATFVWDGKLLPGAWLLTEAFEQAFERAPQYGVVTAAIRNCHHTCALATYLRRATDRGLIAQLSVSNPGAARMAPFGGTVPLLTPNPLAVGVPTRSDPILVDVSSSITTTTMTQQLAKKGERFPDKWALTAQGVPTDDPSEVTDRKGSLMPLGGAEKGHKGFGLALMVDLLGQGLSGKGRADAKPGVLAQAAFLQVIDPAAFAGLDAFTEQSEFTANACRTNPPAPGVSAVRVPGDSASRKRRRALQEGVAISDELAAKLARAAERVGVAFPTKLTLA